MSRNFQQFMEPGGRFLLHKNLSLFLILSQINPISTIPHYFRKYNTTHSLSPVSSRSIIKDTVCISHTFHACCMFRPPDPPSIDYPSNILRGVLIANLLITQFCFMTLIITKYRYKSPAGIWSRIYSYGTCVIELLICLNLH